MNKKTRNRDKVYKPGDKLDFRIRNEDEITADMINAQSNKSESIALLWRWAYEKFGCVDLYQMVFNQAMELQNEHPVITKTEAKEVKEVKINHISTDDVKGKMQQDIIKSGMNPEKFAKLKLEFNKSANDLAKEAARQQQEEFKRIQEEREKNIKKWEV